VRRKHSESKSIIKGLAVVALLAGGSSLATAQTARQRAANRQ
jgi:hypothetical protein